LKDWEALVKADQKVTLAMTPAENGKTSVACRATMEDMGFCKGSSSPARPGFRRETFEAIERRLKELAYTNFGLRIAESGIHFGF